MIGSVVVELLQLLTQHGIEVCVDGGWGVDALLAQQTRAHSDLDIAIPHKDVPRLRELLEARGYKDVPRDDTRYPVRCVSAEWMVKFHTGYTLDENDYHDVAALCHRFGIELPAEYRRFR